MHGRRILGFPARVALVYKADHYGLPHHFLHLPTQFVHLRPRLLLGWGNAALLGPPAFIKARFAGLRCEGL